jgi:hypothetical protein
MAEFKKYEKRKVVVGAIQITQATAGNYGVVGDLGSGDWMLYLVDGTIVSMDPVTFAAKYISSGDTAALQGTDYD